MNNYGYNCKEKIKELINISIESRSRLCFNFLINKFLKDYYPNDIELFNILKKVLIYEEFSFFNQLYNN